MQSNAERYVKQQAPLGPPSGASICNNVASTLSSGMLFVIGFREVLDREVGVNLGGGRGGVTQQLLDGAQVGAMGE